MTKGFLTPQLGKIEQAFPVKHLTYLLDEGLDKFDPKHISIDFDRVTENIVEIEYFSYGKDQIYKWGKKVKKPEFANYKKNVPDVDHEDNDDDDEKEQ